MNKDVRQLVRKLEAQGFDVTENSRHLKVYRDGMYVATLPKTPKDWRAIRNAVAVLKRVGYRP